MSKYIDADRLKAEITDLCANANFYQQKAIEESNREDFVSSGGEIFAYAKVLSLINSLQQDQPEVDLEKEVRTYCCSSFRFNYDELNDSFYSNAFEFDDAVELARHFYELGQQEMRHRIMNPEYNAKVVERLKSEYPIIKEE